MSEELEWIAREYPEGYALILCENDSASELLYRLSGRPDQGIRLTKADASLIELHNLDPELEDLDHLDQEALSAAGFLGPHISAIARVGTTPGWTFALLTNTGYVSQVDLPVTISYETRAVLHSADVNATQRVAYAVNGRMLSAFDPLHPHYNDGEDPSTLPPPTDGWRGRRKHTLAYLSAFFGVCVPSASEYEELPAAALTGPTPAG